jgi:hypothetical protein
MQLRGIVEQRTGASVHWGPSTTDRNLGIASPAYCVCETLVHAPLNEEE